MLTLGAAASNMGDMTGTQMKSPAYTFAALASQFKKENSIDVNDLAWHPLHPKCLAKLEVGVKAALGIKRVGQHVVRYAAF